MYIQSFETNCLGTKDFTAKFPKMRKAQVFTVYPIQKDQDGQQLMVQSATRIALVNLKNGAVKMAGPHPNGAHSIHLQVGPSFIFKLEEIDLQALKMEVFASANKEAGKAENGAVIADNSGAFKIF